MSTSIPIGGLQKTSLIDYPGKVAAVVFTRGCAWRCAYCHNPELTDPAQFDRSDTVPTAAEVLRFLESRRNQLEGVVISGGEPTLHAGLGDFISKIRAMGFAIKLDTSGVFPDRLEKLLEAQLLDFIAMDLKAVPEAYPALVNGPVDPAHLRRSADLIRNCGLPHEFRTTVLPGFHDPKDLTAIAQWAGDASPLAFQRFIPENACDPAFRQREAPTLEALQTLSEEVATACNRSTPIAVR
ncbi:MAG: anaerobic ribonucleoside-triphosphate reductase activating protein [Opitutales bacterium]